MRRLEKLVMVKTQQYCDASVKAGKGNFRMYRPCKNVAKWKIIFTWDTKFYCTLHKNQWEEHSSVKRTEPMDYDQNHN